MPRVRRPESSIQCPGHRLSGPSMGRRQSLSPDCTVKRPTPRPLRFPASQALVIGIVLCNFCVGPFNVHSPRSRRGAGARLPASRRIWAGRGHGQHVVVEAPLFFSSTRWFACTWAVLMWVGLVIAGGPETSARPVGLRNRARPAEIHAQNSATGANRMERWPVDGAQTPPGPANAESLGARVIDDRAALPFVAVWG